MSLKILVLGVNGFIGNSLTEAILQQKDWEIYGMDMATNKLEECLGHPRFHFTEGDITIHKEWVEYHIKKCDVVFPLVAIATPSTYVNNPLRVFELDFEANLEIVRLAHKYNTHLIFPSTSEVYGMCPDEEFTEDNSNLVLGPIHKERWIYSNCKQLLDRVIYAYGNHRGLSFSLFRPFNWLGPKLDNVLNAKEGSSRVSSQFIGNILRGDSIKLVNGGMQRRCFTDIDDGIACLMKIIEHKDTNAKGQIFNVGNPYNNLSIRELAEMLIALIKTYPKYAKMAESVQLIDMDADAYYGKGYQDVSARVPSIKNAEQLLGWQPKVDMHTSLKKTLDYYLLNE